MSLGSTNAKLEAALKAIVDALAIEGLTVNTGSDDETLALPWVICSVEGNGQEVEHDLGIYRFNGSVQVATALVDESREDHLQAHKDLASQIEAVIQINELAANINAVAVGCYVYQVASGCSETMEEKGRLKTVFPFELVATGISIT